MKEISLYEEKDTPIHALDPLTKILYILAAILVPALYGGRTAMAAFIAASIAVLLAGRVLRRTLPILSFSFIVLITVVIIQGLFRAGNTTVAFALGPVVFYREGLSFALGIGLNVVNILLSFSILVLTTRPSDLVEAMVRLGLSPKLGYVLASVFQIIPQMTATMGTITDAQRSRGMETEGSLLVRVKAFLPLIAPVVMNSLITTKERAIALEVRGFDSRREKTFLRERKARGRDKAVNALLAVLIVLALIGRVTIWLT